MVNFLENVVTTFKEKLFASKYMENHIFDFPYVQVYFSFWEIRAGYFRKKPCLNGSESSKTKLENAVIYAVPNTRGITAL